MNAPVGGQKGGNGLVGDICFSLENIVFVLNEKDSGKNEKNTNYFYIDIYFYIN